MQIPWIPFLLLAVTWSATNAHPETFSHADTPQIVTDHEPFEKAILEVSQQIKYTVAILLADDTVELAVAKDAPISLLSHFTQLDKERGDYSFSGKVRIGNRAYHLTVDKKGKEAANLIGIEGPDKLDS